MLSEGVAVLELREEFLSREEIFHGRIVDLRVDTVRLPNGHITIREVVDHPGGVGVVAIDENDMVYTVKQYRYPFGKVLEEIPAGKLERGEAPYEAAMRELREETGLSCDRLIPLGAVLPSPGGFGERLHLYLAEGLHAGEQQPDEDEFLTCGKTPFAELLSRVMSGEIEDGKTVAGILKVHARRTISPKEEN
ncbi:MAG: NUDIX hydrolase [Oscillospiraceae bacterium]|nr:NUDIX hydrolase [Oscillospiraceae bacterium]